MMKHRTAKANHYDGEAEAYDAFNEKNSVAINKVIEKVLKENGVKSVLDMTCGTGSQVFWLKKRGFDVVGSDINEKMLTFARSKGEADFVKGDMRKVKVGEFDAVITIFNAIGHLTRSDFEKTIRNVRDNLKKGGLYIFDIFNLEYLVKDDRITKLTIDWQKQEGKNLHRVIQYSTIDKAGVLASHTTSIGKKVTKTSQTLQIYSADQLKAMLKKGGFKVLQVMDADGSKFNKSNSERILIIAKA